MLSVWFDHIDRSSPCLRVSVAKIFPRFVAGALLLSFLAGCTLAKVDVEVVSERTSLENQVLGTYNRLSNEVMLVASVRGVTPGGKIVPPPPRSGEQQEAVEALETLAFHADDLDRFLRLGWLGESLEGTVVPYPRQLPATAEEDMAAYAARFSDGEFAQIVAEVNQAREVLMLRVVRTNENFTAQDLPAIRRVFARLNRGNSPPGSRIQEEGGQWVVR
jgi:hypothetical protein